MRFCGANGVVPLGFRAKVSLGQFGCTIKLRELGISAASRMKLRHFTPKSYQHKHSHRSFTLHFRRALPLNHHPTTSWQPNPPQPYLHSPSTLQIAGGNPYFGSLHRNHPCKVLSHINSLSAQYLPDVILLQTPYSLTQEQVEMQLQQGYRNSLIEHEMRTRFSNMPSGRETQLYNDPREHEMKEFNTENWLNNSMFDRQYYSGTSSTTSSNFFNQKPHYYPNLDSNFTHLTDEAIFNKRPDELFQQNIYEKSPSVEQAKELFQTFGDNLEQFPESDQNERCNSNFNELGVTNGSSTELGKKCKDEKSGTSDNTKSCRAWVDFNNL